jgi:ribosomal protein S12 methylthiotransferase
MYGSDLAENINLGYLLKQLDNIDDIEWIRIMYAHPAHIDDSTINALTNNNKVLPYIDLPLQHVNDRMLKMMNRKIDRKGIEGLLEKLRTKIPNLVLRTTLIAGFPGETEKEFEELLDFCDFAQFDNLGIFKYSPEDGTPAVRLPGRLAENLVDERYHALLDLQNTISEAKLGERIGQIERILIDEVKEDSKIQGRAWFQAPEVDGQIIIENGTAPKGEFLEVEFMSADAYDIYARSLKQE